MILNHRADTAPMEAGKTAMAVAIVNYNTREHLRACLATVLTEAPNEVILVDNASSDGSVEMVQADYPDVVLQANKTNVGYGAAANQAIASFTAKYVLLLNADTLLQPGALRALATYLDLHSRAAVVGPRLVNPDGTLQESCYPFAGTLEWVLDNDAWLRLIRYVPVLRNHWLRTWSHTYARVVPCVKGAALAIRREAFDAVGGFDESFFLYFEEMDLCHRLKAAGWQVHFAPVATVVHVGGASTMQYSTEMTVQFVASNLLFCQRHHSRPWFAGLTMIMKGIILARLIRDTVRLRIARDTSKRVTISAELTGWKRLLFGRVTRG